MVECSKVLSGKDSSNCQGSMPVCVCLRESERERETDKHTYTCAYIVYSTTRCVSESQIVCMGECIGECMGECIGERVRERESHIVRVRVCECAHTRRAHWALTTIFTTHTAFTTIFAT